MKGRRNDAGSAGTRGRGARPVRRRGPELETRRGAVDAGERKWPEKPKGPPPPDLALLKALQAWESSGLGGETAYEAAANAGERTEKFALRGAYERFFRHFGRLGWLAERVGLNRSAAPMWALYMSVALGIEPEKVAPSAVVMRAEIRPLAQALGRARALGLEAEGMPPDVRLECPAAFWPPFEAAFGAGARAELAALNVPAAIDLRVNSIKGLPEAAMTALEAVGIAAAPTPLSPWGLRVKGRPDVAASEPFKSGLIEVQDEGSQLVALMVGARPGMQALDFCAGAGGKTLALAAAMGNRGHLVAADVNERRLARAKVRLKRAGAENASRVRLTGTDDDPFLKSKAGLFDRVLVDAPCSGTGAWRRNPDAKWRAAGDLAGLAALQDAILARAARLAKPGGRIVYSTCSVLPIENEERVAAFLAATPGYRRLDAAEVWAESSDRPWPCRGREALSLTPAQHGTDGFYAAVIEREKPAKG